MLSKSINKYKAPHLEKVNPINSLNYLNKPAKNQNHLNIQGNPSNNSNNSTLKKKNPTIPLSKNRNLNALYSDIPKSSSSKHGDQKKLEIRKFDRLENTYKVRSAKPSPVPVSIKREVSPALINIAQLNNIHISNSKTLPKNAKPPSAKVNNLKKVPIPQSSKPVKKDSFKKDKGLAINPKQVGHPVSGVPKQSLTPSGLNNDKMLFFSFKNKQENKPELNMIKKNDLTLNYRSNDVKLLLNGASNSKNKGIKSNNVNINNPGNNNAGVNMNVNHIEIQKNYDTMPRKPPSGQGAKPSTGSSNKANLPLQYNSFQSTNLYKQGIINTTKAKVSGKSGGGVNTGSEASQGTGTGTGKSSHLIGNKSYIEHAYSEDQNTEYRETMEDCSSIVEKIGLGSRTFSLFSLYDGHGGDSIAKFTRDKMPIFLNKYFTSTKGIDEGFTLSFKNLDNEIKGMNNSDKEGTTVSVLLIEYSSNNMGNMENTDNNHQIQKPMLYCANVGDSRVMLVTQDKVEKFSYDHKANDPTEADRVKKAGGIIFGGRVYGKFALTRALGDFELKQYGVSCNPNVYKKGIEEGDRFVIVASDGVWDVVSDDLLLEMSQKYNSAEEFCNELVKTSLENGTQDNISCIVIRLK